MAKNYRKPIPKSQKEILNTQIEPYDSTRGNPNESDNFTQTNKNFNRAEKLSFKGDTTKPFSIGLQDIDESIFYYFNEVIKPSVIQHGERIAVPVLYGSPERWKSVKKDGYLRDKNGALMNPLIMVKRSSLERNNSLSRKLDANNPNLYTSWQKHYNQKNFYNNFNALNNSIPTKQFVTNVVPDYVTINYDCIIQTYYVHQLNKIIEAINYASNAYWGDPSRFKFNTVIDSFNIVNEYRGDKTRVATSSFTIKLHGYIIPDVIQKDLNSVKKYNSKSKIIFSMETDAPSELFTNTSDKIIPKGNGNGGNGTAKVQNTNSTYTEIVASGDILTLPDITVTDSDGSIYTQPSVQDVTCTPQDNTITMDLSFIDTDNQSKIIFNAAGVTTYTTLVSDTNIGTLTISTDNVTFSAFSLPFTPIVSTPYYFKRTGTGNGSYIITD